MKKILSLALLATLFLSVSCVKGEKFADESLLKAPGVYGYLAQPVSDDPGTKATVTPDIKFSFEVGDLINIWSEVGTLLIYSVTELTPTGGAVFNGGGFTLTDGMTYYTLYPLISSFRKGMTQIPVSYEGQVQTADNDANHVAEYSQMLTSATCENGSTHFGYKHLSRWFRFQMTLPKTMTVTELTVTADSPVFAASGKVNVLEGTFTPDALTDHLTLKLDNVEVTDGVLNAFMAHAPYGPCNIVVSVKDSEGKVYSSPVIAQADASATGKYRTISSTLAEETPGSAALEEGSYVVLAVDSDNAMYALQAQLTPGKHYLRSKGYSDDLTFYSGDADIIWNVTRFGNSYIFENDGKNLGYSGSGDTSDWLAPGADWAGANYLLDIAKQESEDKYYVTLHSDSSRYLSKRTTGSNFAFHEGTDQTVDIIFVPAAVDNRTPVSLTFWEQEYSFSNLTYGEFTGQTAEADPAVTGITYSAEGDPIGTVDAATGAVALNGTAGRMIVEASFAGDANYRPAFVQYAITVTIEKQEAGMSWVGPDNQPIFQTVATMTDDEITFTPPILIPGNATNITYNSTDPTVATINSAGEITIVGGGNTSIQAIFEGDDYYLPQTVEYIINVVDNRSVTIDHIRMWLQNKVKNAVVMATCSDSPFFVISDGTGLAVVMPATSNHGFKVGDVVTVEGMAVSAYGVLCIDNPTVTKTGTTTPSYPEAAEFDADKITAYETASTVEYAHAKGVVNGYDLTVADGKVLNVYGDMSAAEGRTADIYGYSIGYDSGKVRFMLVGTPTIDETVPYISVTPGSYTWSADETAFKQFAVTLNENNIGFSTEVLSGNSADWTYNGSSSILFIKPKAANTSTTEDKVIVIRIKHSGVYQDVTCTQRAIQLLYTLDGTVTSSGNAYATASDVTQDGIDWKVMANTTMNPWRVGGKSITNVDRPIYSTTAIEGNVSRISVGSGAAHDGLAANSLTISIHNSAADAASGSNPIATKSFTTGIVGATVTFEKEDNTSWAGKYYRIVYNVTSTVSSGNGYISFYSAQFYGAE